MYHFILDINYADYPIDSYVIYDDSTNTSVFSSNFSIPIKQITTASPYTNSNIINNFSTFLKHEGIQPGYLIYSYTDLDKFKEDHPELLI